MKVAILLLGVLLSLAIGLKGKKIDNAEIEIEYLPIEGRGMEGGRGSACIIKPRSINVDNDDHGTVRQLTTYDDDDVGSSEDEANEQDYDEYPSQYPPHQMQGDYGQQFQDYGPPEDDTSLSLSSEPNFGPAPYTPLAPYPPPPYPYPYPQFYRGDQEKIKYNRRRGSGGGSGGKKGGGNINCIIITKTKTKQGEQKKKPLKLFGWLPITRRRRSIANHYKSLKAQ